MTGNRYAVAHKTCYYGPRDEYRLIKECDTRAEAEEVAASYESGTPMFLGHNEYWRGTVVLEIVSESAVSPTEDWTGMPSDAEQRACELDPEGEDPSTALVALEERGYILLADEESRTVLYCRAEE